MEKERGRACKAFNQLIVNEYNAAQGIAQHTDRTHVFGPVVAGLSLFSAVVIEFRAKKGGAVKEVLLPPRSVFIMTGPARYEWTHGIKAEREHKFCGHRVRR